MIIKGNFSVEMTQIIMACRQEAQKMQCQFVSPAHLLLGMMRETRCAASELLCRFCQNTAQLRRELEAGIMAESANVTLHPDDIMLDNKAAKIMKLGVLEAHNMGSKTVETEHMLLAILREGDNNAHTLLKNNQVSYRIILDALKPENEITGGYGMDEEDDDDEQIGNIKTRRVMKDKKTSKTPALDSFGTDLTEIARSGKLDPVVGREKEVERIAQILSRRKKNNPVLIGEPGVGKSAIVEGLALRIVKHEIARSLWNKRVVSLDLGSVVAGTKYRGQFEERLRAIIAELKNNPDVIVFIDEIHTLVGAGSAAGTMDAANMLKPALARGEVQCVGSTTLDEYRKSIEKDGALERRFQKVMVEATTAAETLSILKQLKSRYEEHHNVTYTDEALEACVKYTERYISDRSFPDKALDAMDEAGARENIKDTPVSEEIAEQEQKIIYLTEKKNQAAKDQNFELAASCRDQLIDAEAELARLTEEWERNQKASQAVVGADQIAEVVAMMTGVPVQRIGQEENERLRNMQQILSDTIIGQNDAIRLISKAIQRSRLGLKDPKRPIGTFLFVGPTGVGKTYLAKKLAEEMFGTEDAIIRIDMSEYMEKHSVSRMVGAPPGYVGYDEGGQLTERVRRKPYSIILLDEIEKAHHDVFNLLLQVTDEGRLTDGNGITVDFRNTIIIMTSNCGTRQLREFGKGIGFNTISDPNGDKSYAHSVIKKALQKQFAPEFLNRLDEIVYFDQLDKEAINKIIDIELRPLRNRILEMGYNLILTDKAKDFISTKGYDVQYGARPLKRALQTYLEDPICELLMSEDSPMIGSTLTASLVDGNIKIESEK